MSKVVPGPVDLILTLGRKPESLLPGTSCSALFFAMTQGCWGSFSPLIPNPSILRAPFPLNPSPCGPGISDFTFVRLIFSTCNGGIGDYLMGMGGGTGCIFQREQHQRVAYPTNSCCEMGLTVLHWEVGSVFPSLELGRNFEPVLTNRL